MRPQEIYFFYFGKTLKKNTFISKLYTPQPVCSSITDRRLDLHSFRFDHLIVIMIVFSRKIYFKKNINNMFCMKVNRIEVT